jgi:uncharacterized protein with PIN domain
MKFFCDVMLGKLAKYLRLLGFDTRYQNRIAEDDLIATARRENRIILTRKVKWKGMESIIFINFDSPREQLRFLLGKLNLKGEMKPFSRCLVCNTELVAVSKEEVKGKVPYFILKTQERFSQCPTCQRIYWSGSHRERMEEFLTSFV